MKILICLFIHLGAACVIIIARKNQYPKALIEVANCIQIPINSLGKFLNIIIKTLNLEVPPVNPKDLIEILLSNEKFSFFWFFLINNSCYIYI